VSHSQCCTCQGPRLTLRGGCADVLLSSVVCLFVCLFVCFQGRAVQLVQQSKWYSVLTDPRYSLKRLLCVTQQCWDCRVDVRQLPHACNAVIGPRDSEPSQALKASRLHCSRLLSAISSISVFCRLCTRLPGAGTGATRKCICCS